MRTVIGWMAAMLASALLGAVVYENVLSKPVPASEQTATVETVAAGADAHTRPCTGPRSRPSSNPLPPRPSRTRS